MKQLQKLSHHTQKQNRTALKFVQIQLHPQMYNLQLQAHDYINYSSWELNKSSASCSVYHEIRLEVGTESNIVC